MRTATLILPPSAGVVGFGRFFVGRPRLADHDRHFGAPARPSSPAAGTGRPRGRPGRDFGFFLFAAAEPGFAQRRHRFGAQLADHVRDRAFFFALGDDDRDGRAGSISRPALGDWRITWPAGCAFLFLTLGTRPSPRICCTATARWVPTRTGTLTSFGPLETIRVTVEPRVAVLPPEGSEWITRPESTVSELTVLTSASKPGFFSFSFAPLTGEARGCRDLGAAGAGADGQRHLRLRAEEAEEGAVERGLIGGRRSRRFLLEHRVRRRFALDPLHFADREAVLLEQRYRDVELVARHVGDAGGRCRGSRRSRPGRRAGRRDRDQQPAAAGGAAPPRSGSSVAPRGSPPPAAAARRRRCRRRARRAPSSPRRARR